MLKKLKEGLLKFGRKAADLAKKAAKKLVDIFESLIKKAVEYAREHPGEAISIAGACFTGAMKLRTWHKEFVEIDRRQRDFYDPRLGKHVFARRRPSTKDLIRIDERYKAGESYTEIFDDLGLLANR